MTGLAARLRSLSARATFIRALTTRLGGAALLLLSVAVGLRTLGESHFGLAMLAVAVGQIAAFPVTAIESLVIRSVATGDRKQSTRLLLLSAGYAAVVAVLTAVVSLTAPLDETFSPLFVLAAGATAVSHATVVTRQALNRAAGRMAWGQMPNELVRPAVMIAAFVAFPHIWPRDPGSAAILASSLVTLAVVAVSPRDLPSVAPTDRADETGATRRGTVSSTTSMMTIALVGVLVERGLSVALGTLHSPAAVAQFTVAMRVIQVGTMGHTFGNFYFSPQVARALAAGREGLPWAAKLTGRIRLVGALTAVPVSLLCVFAPGVISGALGAEPMPKVLALTTVALLARFISGTTQSFLVMAGDETLVAGACVTALAVATGLLLLSPPFTIITASVAMGLHYALWAVALTGLARSRYKRWI